MGLFKRMGTVVRGFFGLFVRRMEDKNPEAIFEDIKNQIEKARKEAERSILEIHTSAELIKIEMKNAERNLNAVKDRIDAAKVQGKKDILIELLVQEEEYQTTYETHNATYDNAMTGVAKIRDDFKIFESEMNVKLSELKTLKSQAKMAALRENINSVNANYTSRSSRMGSINDNMDRAREIVNRKTARANAVESLGGENMELKFKRLDINSARERARIRAETMLSGEQGFEVIDKIKS